MEKDLVVQVANYLLSKGISVIPISRASKRPVIQWVQYQSKRMESFDKYENCNLGVVTGKVSNLVIVDCDSINSYAAWLKHGQRTPLRVRSRKGMHFYYRHPGERVRNAQKISMQKIDPSLPDEMYDVRGDGGMAVSPPSISKGFQYQYCICSGNIRGKFIEPENLPVFDMKWRPETKKISASQTDESEIKDIEAYIAKITAVEGSSGDKATWTVCKLIAESGVSMVEGMSILSAWNQASANPPWSTNDLVRKLELAFSEQA